MKKQNNNVKTIWNSEINLEDWKEWIQEEHPEAINDANIQYDLIQQELQWELDDEATNLDKYLDNKIVIIADLGLWDGRKQACKLLGSNLNHIFEIGPFDKAHWYYNRFNVMCTQPHHDGVNYFLFRELKKPEYWNRHIVPKILNQTLTIKDVSRYTKSLVPYLKEIYG